MNKPLLFALPGAEQLAAGLAALGAGEQGSLVLHRFPDGECCPRFGEVPRERDVVLAASMDQPDAKLFELFLCARIARELGARSVGLVLPYLPYMRQDCVFRPGEGISARHVAELLSSCADWLVTLDPHLHRLQRLDEVYRIPAIATSAAGPVARWIAQNVTRPVVIGPDSESAQWVSQVAGLVGCPYLVMEKERLGDRKVHVSLSGPAPARGQTPVLLDDIASSGYTMAQAIAELRNTGSQPPVCVVVHPVFAAGALELLQKAGAQRVVSCNTIPHASNAIDICQPLAEAMAGLLARAERKERAA